MASGAFEKVVMHNSETRDVLGEATFSTAAAPVEEEKSRGGSPPAPAARGRGGPAAAAAQRRQPAAVSTAANRNKSVVASTAKRVGNNGRGPIVAAKKVKAAPRYVPPARSAF